MVIGHWTHLATLVQIGPCLLGPNCIGPLCLQFCLGGGNRLPCLFWRIERTNASQLPFAHARRLVVDAPLELAAARLDHAARIAAAASEGGCIALYDVWRVWLYGCIGCMRCIA